MNTMTLDAYQVPTTLNQLIFGDRNTFIFIPNATGDDNKQTVDEHRLAKLLHKLDKKGYAIANAHIMLNWTLETYKQFKQQFFDMVDANTKEGMIFRKRFAQEDELDAYSDQEWLAILAQYSITYAWSEQFGQYVGRSADDVLGEYVDSMSKRVFKQKGKTRIFNLAGKDTLTEIVRDIVESPVVLRTQQIKTLEATPADVLAKASSHAKITVKETLIKVMTLVSGQKLNTPILKTATDVVRYVLATSVNEPFEGQITKQILKKTKHRIPTRIRKALLDNMEAIAASHKDGIKFLAEDMLTYADYWKRLDKYLRFTTSKVMRERYPAYTQAIDLLYTGDRSWTFNGRVSAAKSALDYDAAIRVMAERPGVLMRNIVEYLRMTKGQALPVKASEKQKKPVINAFQRALMGVSANKPNRIQKDASSFFKSEDFVNVIAHNLNTKLAWQLIEQLKDKSLQQPIYKREVQGKYIEYTTPIPGVDPELTKVVRKQLLQAIKSQLRERNQDIGKVYIDDDSKDYSLQYSGRKSTEVSFAGEFLAPGTSVRLSDYLSNGKNRIKDPIIRLGVMWRSRAENTISMDIDHNVTLDNGTDVYYGEPTYVVDGKVLATSSGDITSCGGHTGKFSTELIDLDPVGLAQAGVKNLFSSMINYSGVVPIGAVECYLFFTLIERKDRVMGKKTSCAFDLSKLDYAIQVDANNTDNTGSYIGIQIDLENDQLKALSIPVKSKDRYTNVRVNKKLFDHSIANLPEYLTIGYALKAALPKAQRVDDPVDADVIISRQPLEAIIGDSDVGNGAVTPKAIWHPGRDAEKINGLLF